LLGTAKDQLGLAVIGPNRFWLRVFTLVFFLDAVLGGGWWIFLRSRALLLVVSSLRSGSLIGLS